MPIALPIHHTEQWHGRAYQHDDFDSASGMVLFALQHCFAVRWAISGASSDTPNTSIRESRSWQVVDAMFQAAAGCTSMGTQLCSVDDGTFMALAVRSLSRRFAHWLAVQVRCCFCYGHAKISGINEVLVYPAQAPRPACRCGTVCHRHPRCQRCFEAEVEVDEEFDAWCSRQFARTGDSDSS